MFAFNPFLREQLGLRSSSVSVELEPEPQVRTATFSVDTRTYAAKQEIPSDFSPVGLGFFRCAHSIWELRPAEDDGGGFVLVRKREERAVDFRTAHTHVEASCSCGVGLYRCGQCGCEEVAPFDRGDYAGLLPPVLHSTPMVVDDGVSAEAQAKPGITIVLSPNSGLRQQPEEPEEEHDHSDEFEIPEDLMQEVAGPREIDLCESGLCPCKCHADEDVEIEGFEVEDGESDDESDEDSETESDDSESELEPTEKTAATFDSDTWGATLSPAQAFYPVLMAGRVRIDPDDGVEYRLEGVFNQQSDAIYKVPDGRRPGTRVRLSGSDGQTVFVTEKELERFFSEPDASQTLTEDLGMPPIEEL